MTTPAKMPQERRERRRAPRLEVSGSVVTRLLTLLHPVQLRDIGSGGCLIESLAALPVGTGQQMTLTSEDGDTVHLAVRVAHCRKISAPDGRHRFAIGLSFVVPPDRHREGEIDRIIDKITAKLSFD